jgi:hypothetical protein
MLAYNWAGGAPPGERIAVVGSPGTMTENAELLSKPDVNPGR